MTPSKSLLGRLTLLFVACEKNDKGDGSGEDDTGQASDDTGQDTGDTDDTGDEWVDEDGDGHEPISSGGTDCDDSNPDIHPGADEACNDIDDDCDGDVDEGTMETWWWGGDADGYGNPANQYWGCEVPDNVALEGGDCDDEDAAVHPDADEYCDEVDNDCDDEVDEDALDATTRYTDADADGYGDESSPVLECSQPTGTVTDATDCDDSTAEANPGVVESCDGIDNDCDGDVDEPDAPDAGTWYVDSDGDGYGDEASATTACDAPSGTIDVGGDCDDTDAAINPAASEVCDLADNDCDGTADEDDAVDAGTWYVDADGDGFGDATVSRRACEQPSGMVEDDTDCDDGDAATNPAGTEVCDGIDNDCDGITDFGNTVPGTWPDIQTAIDSVSDGDTICVNAGTYTENIAFGGKAITVWGTAGAASTYIDGDGVGPVVTFAAGETASAVLDGFTITGGEAERGAGVYVDGADPTLRNLVIAHNACAADVCEGVGIYLVDSAATFQDCEISSNEASPTGATEDNLAAGVALYSSAVSFEGLDLSANSTTLSLPASILGSALSASESTVLVTDGTIEDNSASCVAAGQGAVYGGAVWAGSSDLTLESCTVSSNQAQGMSTAGTVGLYGGAVALESSTATINDTVFDGNLASASATAGSSSAYGGALYASASTLTLSASTLSANELECDAKGFGNGTTCHGGAIHVGDASTLSLDGVAFSGNAVVSNSGSGSAEARGGGLAGFESDLALSGCSFEDNTLEVSTINKAAASGGGIYFDNSSSNVVIVEDCTFAGNLLDASRSTSSSRGGGGIAGWAGEISVDRTLLADNGLLGGTACGGALYFHSGSIAITNAILAGNTAGDGTGNTACGGGAALGADGAEDLMAAVLTNVDLTGNAVTADNARGGGIYVWAEDSSEAVTILNTNIVSNSVTGTATTSGGAMTVTGDASPTTSITYSNAYDNGTLSFDGIVFLAGTGGRKNVDPGYTDTSATDAADWDLTLMTGSSCIDAGDPGILDADGSTSDIGAYGGPFHTPPQSAPML